MKPDSVTQLDSVSMQVLVVWNAGIGIIAPIARRIRMTSSVFISRLVFLLLINNNIGYAGVVNWRELVGELGIQNPEIRT